MTLLALDTSTEWASVALYDGHDVLAEETWRAQRRHADELFPTIERLLARTRITLASVDKVAVARELIVHRTAHRDRGCAGTPWRRGDGRLSTLDGWHTARRVNLRTSHCCRRAAEFYAAFYQERNASVSAVAVLAATLPLCRQMARTLSCRGVDGGPRALRDCSPESAFASPSTRMRRAGPRRAGWVAL